MKLGLVFTNDWELYGDGTGDYFEVQHRPLEWLAKTLENHGAKLTIMAEVGQQWAHMDIAGKSSWAAEIVSAWESSLVNRVKMGHDVQLHLHPQWLGAKYNGSRWKLNLDKWALPNLSPEEMDQALARGKACLESLLSEVNPDYKCIAFRSGAYCVQPSSQVISGLVRNGLVCDTSVTKSMVEDGLFDFREAFSNFLPWFVNPGFIEQKAKNPSGLIEIPIYSMPLWDSPILRWKFGFCYGTLITSKETKWFNENDRVCNARYPTKNRPFRRRFKPIYFVQALLRRAIVPLDYDRLSAEVFAKMLKHAMKDSQIQGLDDPEIIFPIVATGHVKNIHNAANIERILDRLQPLLKDEMVVYWTLTDAIHHWFERLKGDYECNHTT
ncbi:MAG: hypothetical protein ACLQMS_11010 [Desulfomonilaceae bacterium]